MIVGGRDARHPADRRDAAVRLLRRLVDRGQLRAARAAAADLRPRPAGGGSCDERADRPPVRPRRRAVRGARRASPRAGRCSTPPRCATTRSTTASCSRSSSIHRGRILAADGTVLARSVKRTRPATDLRPHLPDARPVRPRGRLRLHRHRPRRPRALLRRRAHRRRDGPAHAARPAARAAAQVGDDLVHASSTRRRSASRCSSSAGARARSSRWTRAPGRSK